MSAWPVPIGTRVRFLGAEPGRQYLGTEVDGVTHWLCGHAEGEVVEIIRGYARHRCPDHDGGIDCICQDESGWVDAMEPAPVVNYVCGCGESVVPRTINSDDEGERWELVR